MITIKDIARDTGFSVTTVSAVLGNRADTLGIKEETRRVIREASHKLGYRRNELASQMQSGQSKTMFVFFQKCAEELYACSALRATNAAFKYGYNLKEILYDEKADDFEALLNQCLGQWPAAFFSWGDNGENYELLLQYARKYRIPLASLDIESESADFSVLTDDRSGIAEAVDYLYRQGHRRIAHATDTPKAQYALRRRRLYRECLAERGLAMDEVNSFAEAFNTDPAELIAYAKRLAGAKERPTAITCGSDHIALKLLLLFERFGLRVPEDISLIGYGSLSFARIALPRLTTITQGFEEIGEAALEAMLKRLDGVSTPPRILLPSRLQIAETVVSLHKG